MDLERIELQAFGPYPGCETIDFSRIDASGVFLIEGPTGSGKSSIIDALVFALYGKTPADGPSTHDDRLHSHHASPLVQPSVTVEFRTASGRYGIKRTVAYQRAKQRGAGTTEQKATVELRRYVDGDDKPYEVLATRADEVGVEIRRIIGLTREQFTQTIVLPQGRFASFLTADPEKRSQLLETLFATGVYKRVEEQLADMRRVAERGKNDAGVRLGSLWNHASTELEIDDGSAFDATARDFAPYRDAVEQGLTRLSQRAQDASEAREAAHVALAEAERVLADETALAEKIARRSALKERRESLEERTSAVKTQRAELSAAREAEPVRGAVAARAAMVERLEAATETEREAAERASSVADRDDDELRAEITRISELTGELRSAGEVERGLNARKDQFRSLAASLTERQNQLTQLEAVLEQKPAEKTRVDEAREQAETLASEEQRHRSELEKSRATVERFRALDAALDAEAGQRTHASSAAERAQEANARLSELQTARVAGIAAELAENLRDGEACPVCGAAEHPRLAEKPAGHPSEADLDAARQAYDQTVAMLQKEQNELAAREATRLAAEAEVEGADRDRLTATIDGLEHKLREALTARDEVVRLTAELAALEKETRRLTEEQSTLRTSIAALQARSAETSAAIEADEARVRGAVGAFASVAERVHALEAERASAERLLAAREAVAAARRSLDERETAVAEALAETSFETEEDAEQAARSRAEIADLETAIQRFDAEWAAVEAGEREIADLPAASSADVDAARIRKTQAHEASSAATEQAATAREAFSRATRTANEFFSALDDFEEQRAGSLPITRMADLASGASADNVSGLSLSTFVLLRRFDEVVRYANERLLTMSSGRYALARSDERERSSKRRVGLSLEVLDAQTDRPRNPGSLSGGETFTASLALALGLADAVRAESGGIELGTLFVDEGFGTLDPDYLELVMTELGRLTATGRRVGVVSHVSELKNTIGQKISVRPTGRGSVVEQSR